MMPIILLKAHVKGYTKKDGRYVKPHETKAPGAKQKLKAPQLGLFGGKPSGASHAKPAEPKGPPPGAQPHPQLDHHGERSEEHTSELQSLMRISYAVVCLKKKKHKT